MLPKNKRRQNLAGLLSRYPRPVVHLRQQLGTKRLGLIFGAGLSTSFGLPDWAKLVRRIASEPRVAGERILSAHKTSGLPYQTEMLFQHFRRSEKRKSQRPHDTREFEYDVRAGWLEIVRRQLYDGANARLTRESLSSHPYLFSFLQIIRQIRVTVTYNFDDLIEQALYLTRPDTEVGSSRGYVPVTNGALQLTGRAPIIYHPNGLVPSSNPMERPSDRLIFSEQAYADQLVDSLSGDYTRLVTYLTDNTCLFLGVSLNDQVMRNLLRQCAKTNPGNYHYVVYYIQPGKKKPDDAQRDAVVQTNFRVYNLITLFLDDNDIESLAELLTVEEQQFCELAETNGLQTKYCFYLTGPLGVGKSSAIASLGSLLTFDEWLEPRLPLLAKPWPTLSPRERRTADNWIARQFKLKNDNVRHGKFGIYVLDRGPLDPLAFARERAWPKRARDLLSSICPNKSTWEVEPGCVVLLSGDHRELSLRMRLTGRNRYTADLLSRMERQLRKAYGKDNVVPIDTNGLSPSGVVYRLAELIHLLPYRKMALHRRFTQIQKGAV